MLLAPGAAVNQRMVGRSSFERRGPNAGSVRTTTPIDADPGHPSGSFLYRPRRRARHHPRPEGAPRGRGPAGETPCQGGPSIIGQPRTSEKHAATRASCHARSRGSAGGAPDCPKYPDPGSGPRGRVSPARRNISSHQHSLRACDSWSSDRPVQSTEARLIRVAR